MFDLAYCEVVPTDPAAPQAAAGIAERAANILESTLRTEKPIIVALGTGQGGARRGRARVADRLSQSPDRLAGRQHLGRRLGELLRHGRAARRPHQARHYPMPLPFLMSSEGERDQMLRIDPIAKVRAVAAKADLRLVGIGQMDQSAQVHVDGFVSREELFEMMRLGAVGELTGWAFDAKGRIIKGGTNRRLTSIPPQVPAEAVTIGAAVGARQGRGDQGGAEGASDQRPDHRRGDRKRDPEAVTAASSRIQADTEGERFAAGRTALASLLSVSNRWANAIPALTSLRHGVNISSTRGHMLKRKIGRLP